MKIFEKNNADIESVKVHAFRHMPLRAYATLSLIRRRFKSVFVSPLAHHHPEKPTKHVGVMLLVLRVLTHFMHRWWLRACRHHRLRCWPVDTQFRLNRTAVCWMFQFCWRCPVACGPYSPKIDVSLIYPFYQYYIENDCVVGAESCVRYTIYV